MGLRPYRGTKTKALEENIVLGEGEVFFEFPESGVGTGRGKIKMGDGNTPYGELPYFIYDLDLNGDDVTINFTDSNTATGRTNDPTYLSNINPNANLKRIFTNLKQLLVNYNSELNTVRESISTDENKIANLTTRVSNIEQITSGLVYSPESRNSFYRGKHLGNIHSLETVRNLLIDENHNFRDVFLGDTVTMDFPILTVNNTKWVVAGFNIFMGMVNGFTNQYYPENSITFLKNDHIVLILKDAGLNNWKYRWKTNISQYIPYYKGTYYYSNMQENIEKIGNAINFQLDCLEHIYCPISDDIDPEKKSDVVDGYGDNGEHYGASINTSLFKRVDPTSSSIAYFNNYAMIPCEREFIGDCTKSSSPLDNYSYCAGKFPIYNYISPRKLHIPGISYESTTGPFTRICTRSYAYRQVNAAQEIIHEIAMLHDGSRGDIISTRSDSEDFSALPYIVIS